MLKDLASQKKSDRDIILAAITSLKAKGWHINPYTVADEARIPRSVIVRSSEYMEMVSKARGKAVATTNQVSDELMRQVDLLEEENRGLKDRLAGLTQQCELLAQNVKEAFQQGYNTAKAEIALASGLQEVVRGGTADNGIHQPANDFSDHVPHAQLYSPHSYDQAYQGQSYEQPAQEEHQAYYEQGGEPTTDYPKPGAYYHNESYDEQAYGEGNAYDSEQASYQGEHIQQTYQDALYQEEDDIPYDDQNVETAEHEVFISSHIPELTEDQNVDAFSARLLAALGTEGEADEEGFGDGERYNTGEFAETDIPDWDALADIQQDSWSEDVEQEQLASYEDEGSADLSALGTSIPPPAQPVKFSADDLRQLVNNKLEGNTSYEEPVQDAPSPTPPQPSSSSKFVGTNRQSEAPISAAPVSRMVPPEIRKACLILGIKSDEITRENVNKAWKNEMAKPGVHPDTGGDTEIAIYINNAKESLMKWLDMQAPKLGKKFGAGGKPK